MEWMKPKQEDIMVPCKKCGSKVPASSLKMDLDEGKMICVDCIKNKAIHKEIQKEVFHKDDDSMNSMTKRERVHEAHKVPHKCSGCGYKFMIDTERNSPKNCPYCNVRVNNY